MAFTTSRTFLEKRQASFLNAYSQIINLDFDNIPIEELDILISKINKCSFTFASFVSPKVHGVKVFVKVNTSAQKHEKSYLDVANFYKELTGFDFDPKCKDISRLCFVSSDTETFVNENSEIFKILEKVEIKASVQNDKFNFESTDEKLMYCLKFTENKQQYQQGNRNSFIHLFASNAYRFGIFQQDVYGFCSSNFDLPINEIKATIESVYKNQIATFATFAKFATDAKVKNIKNVKINAEKNKTEVDADEDILLKTPVIPNSVYDNLAPILKHGADAFSEQREKDTFLTGALAILSGCIPNVSGLYSRKKVYPQLFSFILAPAASGKGALQFSKQLTNRYHSEVCKTSLEQKKEFDKKIEASKHAKKFKKKNDSSEDEIIEEPPFKVVFIPANTSNAKIIQHLQCNNGLGIICETEADTMGQTFKNDWGSYSDLMRKAFHYEKISISRKTNNEYFEIDNPQLAVALSGTPSQVSNIIKSAEDGLFSRFVFYVFKTEVKWMDVSPLGNQINLDNHFDKLSNSVYEMFLYLNENPTVVHLSNNQWSEFNSFFKNILSKICTFVSEDASSVVKRLGLIAYRFCMLFTAIRKFQIKENTIDIVCLDIDFKTALSLIDVYIEHSTTMFNNLPKSESQTSFKMLQNKEQFLAALPKKFNRKDAIELAQSFGMSDRTVDGFLKSCLNMYLVQSGFGVYEKV